MSEKSKAFFRKYWDRQNSGLPSHHVSYEEVARELRYYLDAGRTYRALELGCGNGDLYAHLRPCFAEYTGVDFSTSNLEAFAERFPDAELVHSDAMGYAPAAPRNLIFSVQVMQYLDYSQLETLLRRNLEQVGEDFVIAHVGFLDRMLRPLFLRGYLRPGVNRPLLRNVHKPLAYAAYELGARALHGAGRLGFWHRADRVGEICDRLGVNYRITGSMTYRYRFNLLITGKRSGGEYAAS